MKPKNIQFRRRRENKTNYLTRLRLLKSRKPRLVVRKTNTKLIVQIVEFDFDGDKVLLHTDSSALKKMGWTHSTKNIPAAYLTGYLIGQTAKQAKIKEAILDIGLIKSIPGNKIYAVLKGAIDAGLQINHSENVLPTEERIQGQHISEELTKSFNDVKSKIEKV